MIGTRSIGAPLIKIEEFHRYAKYSMCNYNRHMTFADCYLQVFDIGEWDTNSDHCSGIIISEV